MRLMLPAQQATTETVVTTIHHQDIVEAYTATMAPGQSH